VSMNHWDLCPFSPPISLSCSLLPLVTVTNVCHSLKPHESLRTECN